MIITNLKESCSSTRLESFGGSCTTVQATQSWREDSRWVLTEGTWGKAGELHDVNFNLIKA